MLSNRNNSQIGQWPVLPPSPPHLHPCKHMVLFFSASDSTQSWLFLFLRLIAPTEHHWFYGKPCLQAECHRPEVTFCLPQPRQSWTFKSTSVMWLEQHSPRNSVNYSVNEEKVVHEVWFWEVILYFLWIFNAFLFSFVALVVAGCYISHRVQLH